MTYSEIIERVISGVLKDNPQPPLDRIRRDAEAAFPHVLSQVAEAFAGREDRRLLMKQNVGLTFTGGSSPLPDKVLRKYLKDATLIVTVNSGQKQYYSYEPNYADFVRCSDQQRTPDNRLGYWTAIGSTAYAVRPSNLANLNSADVTSVILDAACSPDVPTSATDPFTGPADIEPELINALIETLRGNPVSETAEAA